MTSQSNSSFFLKEANRVVTKTMLKKNLRDILKIPNIVMDDVTHVDLPADQFRDLYLYHTVFDKYNDFDKRLLSERKARCLEKYLGCEAACKTTNDYFQTRSFAGTSVHSLLMLTRKHLSDILGILPDDWYEKSAFGPGSTTSIRYRYSDAVFKIESKKPHCTSLLKPFVEILYKGVWNEFQTNDCAEYTSVPKNSLIERPIEKQPDMNIFMQKALGNIIRSRMLGRYCGRGYPSLDLNSQENNRRLALIGSRTDPSICTLDLSSASDLIATEFVKFVVEDQRWLQALYITRTGLVKLPKGKIIPLQKFSAMGNGYTWELQSAIFYSMIRACNDYLGVSDHVCSIFGDDIICHKDVVPTLMYFLEACGLKVNRTKSFWAGHFRESCGKHYYKGLDVSPFYLRSPLKTNAEIVGLHNRIFTWITEFGYKDGRFYHLLSKLRSMTRCKELYVPIGYGDGGFQMCYDDVPRDLVSTCKDTGNLITMYYHVAKSCLSKPGQPALVKWLMGYRSDVTSASDIPFGKLYADAKPLLIPKWRSFGPWISTNLP